MYLNVESLHNIKAQQLANIQINSESNAFMLFYKFYILLYFLYFHIL
jgi:hypothetical protein